MAPKNKRKKFPSLPPIKKKYVFFLPVQRNVRGKINVNRTKKSLGKLLRVRKKFTTVIFSPASNYITEETRQRKRMLERQKRKKQPQK